MADKYSAGLRVPACRRAGADRRSTAASDPGVVRRKNI